MTMLNVLCVRRPGGSAGFRRLDSDLLLDLCGASLLFFPSPDTSHCHIQSLTRRKYFKCHQLKMKLWKVTVINSWSLLGWFNRFRGEKWRIKQLWWILSLWLQLLVLSDLTEWLQVRHTCSDHLLLESHLIFSCDGSTAARCVFVLPFEFGKKPFICQLFVDPVFFFINEVF